MIEELLLPEGLRRIFMVGTSRFDFEGFDKVCEIAGWKETLSEEVNMIRHDAIGVDCEIPSDGFGAENLEKPTAGRRTGEYPAPAEAADRHKIELAAEVVVR